VTTTQIRNREKLVVAVQQLSAGTAKHMANGATVSFLGATFTEAQISSKLQSLVTLKTDVDDARAAAQAKVAAEKADAPPLLAFMSAYVAYVKAVYGGQPDVLADFGIRPRARVQPSVATKTAAVAKRESTRAARHTMGARQAGDQGRRHERHRDAGPRDGAHRDDARPRDERAGARHPHAASVAQDGKGGGSVRGASRPSSSELPCGHDRARRARGNQLPRSREDGPGRPRCDVVRGAHLGCRAPAEGTLR